MSIDLFVEPDWAVCMAWKPRVEFAGACYHVIARGNRRATLFHDHDEADYAAYLERFRHYQERDHLTCYAFVLMANHLHLLVESGDVPLSRTMQRLQFTRRCASKTCGETCGV